MIGPKKLFAALIKRLTPDYKSMGSRFQWICLIETVLLVALFIAIDRALNYDQLGFLSIHPHPYWTIILFIALRYGLRETVMSSLMVGAVYSYFYMTQENFQFFFSSLTVFSDFKEPISFLILGGLISESIERLSIIVQELKNKLRNLVARNRKLIVHKNQSDKAFSVLESQFSGLYGTMVDIFATLTQARLLPSTQIPKFVLSRIAEKLHAQDCRYYELHADNLIQKFSIPPDSAPTQDPHQDLILLEVLRKKKVAHIGTFKQESDFIKYQGSSLLAGPVLSLNNQVIGIISIERLPFSNFNHNTFRLFETILQFLAQIYTEKQQIEALQAKSIFNEELNTYRYTYFIKRFEQEFNRAKKYATPVSLSLIRIQNWEKIKIGKRPTLIKTIAQIASQYASDLDLIANYHREDTLAVIFPILLENEAHEKMIQIVDEVKKYRFCPYEDTQTELQLDLNTVGYAINLSDYREMIINAEKELVVDE